MLYLWLFKFVYIFFPPPLPPPSPASKVNTTLFGAMIRPVPLLFWCRADGRQVSAARKGREPL